MQSKQPHLLPSELLNPSVPDLPRTSGGAHFLEQNEMAHAEEVNRGTFPDLLDSDSRSAAQTEAFQLGLGSRTSQPGASPMFPATSPLLVRAAGMLRADEASAIVREAEEEGAASGWTSRCVLARRIGKRLATCAPTPAAPLSPPAGRPTCRAGTPTRSSATTCMSKRSPKRTPSWQTLSFEMAASSPPPRRRSQEPETAGG